MATFDVPEESLLRIFWKKKKRENAVYQHFLLFYPLIFGNFKMELDNLSQAEIVICKCFQFGQG